MYVNKNSDGVSETKSVENKAIVILLLIFLIILTPYVTSIIGTSWKKADEMSAKNTIENVKLIYLSEVVSGAYTPFKIEYNRKGYTMYTAGIKYTSLGLEKVETKGQQPKGGSVTIKGDGTVKVKNLRFGILKCNSDKDENIKCGL